MQAATNNSLNSSPQSLQSEVTRILTSNTSSQMVSHLRTLTDSDSKIQEQLKNKTLQISQLQSYLRSQIENIQGIVEMNNKMKRQLEGARVEIGTLKLENQALERQMELVVGNNRRYAGEVEALERRNVQLMTEVRDIKRKASAVKEQAVQTEQDKRVISAGGSSRVSCSANTSPHLSKHSESKLLQKISQLEEAVSSLKLQKSELQAKIHSYQARSDSSCSHPDQSSPLQEEPSSSTLVHSTTQILQLICEDSLPQLKFKGEMVNNLKQGRGVCLYQGHIHYEGHFHQGKRHGLGTLYHFEQEIYRGYWFNGLIQGKGILRMLQGEIETYQGQFYQGRLEGYGCMLLKSGKRVLGMWEEGKIKGNCIQSDHTGKRYTRPELIQCY